MFGLPLVIAAWWIVQFNSASTKAAFAAQAESPSTTRPVIISVLAWLSIVGGASTLVAVFSHTPAFLFGVTFTGWTAAVVYLVVSAISLYVGKGLLDLRERARIVAIGWFAFTFIHLIVVTSIPSLRQRLFALPANLMPTQQASATFDPTLAINFLLTISTIATAVSIGILVQSRDAFLNPQSS